jgi:hypothetical protein
MTFKEKFGQAWTVRGYLISPWKLLFKKKILYGVLIFVLAYWILPSSVTQYVDKAVSPVWKVTRAIAAEIGLLGLVKNSASGVSATVDFIQGPDEIENSLGEAIFYAGEPKLAKAWQVGVSDNVKLAFSGDEGTRFQFVAYRLIKGELSPQKEWEGARVSLLPFQSTNDLAEVAVDKRDMVKTWGRVMQKLSNDLSEMDHLWCLAGVERDETQSVQGIFLLIVDEFRQEVRAQSFYVPRHADSKDKLSSFLIPIDELETKLSIDVLNGLEDALEKKLEAQKLDWAW